MKTSFYLFVGLCSMPMLLTFVWWQVERMKTRRARRVAELRIAMLERAHQSVDRALAAEKVKIAEAVAVGDALAAERDSVVGSRVKAKPCASCGHILLSHRSVSNGRSTEFYECAVRGCGCRKGRRPPPTPAGPHSLA